MQIRLVRVNDNQIAVIELDQDLIGGVESPEVRNAVKELAEQGNRKLILDFVGSLHMNSMGLGVLTSAYITYAKLGGSIALCNCGPDVRTLLKLTRVGTLFEVFGGRDEALKFLSG